MVENLAESDQFFLGRDFIRNFNVTIDFKNAMLRIRKPERKYVIKPLSLIMANEIKAPVFLSRRLMFKANETTIVILRTKSFNELSDTSRAVLFLTENQEFGKRNQEEQLTGPD